MYIRNHTSKNQKAAYYMPNTSITGTSSDGYRNAMGLPRRGGPASPWRACLAVAGVIPAEQRILS
jgi:hypothetical protein